ncbi:MAG: type II toxin-antitoxin system VapC family toxin [Chloroflexota bacterium]|nr:type II toxin-antitoxin system VapC family toxin [Chloroflexota bacterium]
MSEAVVVDASAALNLVLSESGSVVVRAKLEAWWRAGVSVQVPSHFWLEVANALIRRHRLPSSLVIAAIHALDELGLKTIELSRPLVLLALDLADRHGLSMHDAAYLALAESVDGRLLTADRGLLAAASRPIAVPGADHRLSEEPPHYASRQPSWPRYRGISAYLARLRMEAGDASTRHPA